MKAGEQRFSMWFAPKRARKLHAGIAVPGWTATYSAACSGVSLIHSTLTEAEDAPEDRRCRHPACAKRFWEAAR